MQVLSAADVFGASVFKQNYTGEVNCLVALHELYKYINKYYDQVGTAKDSGGCCEGSTSSFKSI